MFHKSRRLRARLRQLGSMVRASEVGLTLLAVVIGLAGGVAVTLMSGLGQLLHIALFGIGFDDRLSTATYIPPKTLVLVPVLGGLLMGLSIWLLRRFRPRPVVDAIEANALHGGRMSSVDSTILAVQTLISNGFGASVGLEAGYTQVCAAIASKLGLKLQMRRNDMRTLVGCGAAAAISAAFNAPLAGAFYAFELIIGNYTIGSVAPVMAAALSSNLMLHLLRPEDPTLALGTLSAITTNDYIAFIFLGFVCGLIGIAIMRGVTLVEELFKKSRLPVELRPAIGGLCVGGLALVTPQVLAAGHGAFHLNMVTDSPLNVLLLLFGLKALASAISLGSGFRGGLFFASLFLGALLGKILAGAALFISPALIGEPRAIAVIAMSALTVAIVGGPLTMGFLALELTGDYVITGLALTAAVVSSLTVRELFGYSFSTWRLHLRGESIRSAHDVGWIRSLTVRKQMQQNVRTVKASMWLTDFRHDFPIGSVQSVVAVDEHGHYAGIVWVSDAYAQEGRDTAAEMVRDLLRNADATLYPEMNIKQAIALFDKTASEALAVVDDKKKVIGFLTEAHALKRYAEELDLARRNLAGE